jgi:release factor glutamine methyltransferase
VFAEDEATLLLGEARNAADLEDMVARRVAGFPLEHIVGWVLFAGLRVGVDAGVFVPRRRTEYLASVAVSLARSRGAVAPDGRPRVLDLCCGSGAIARAVQAGIPLAELYAADLDPAAVRNARRTLLHADRVFEGDLFDALPRSLRGSFDVIVANSPYVPSDALALMPPEARLHEARLALDGGPDGLDLQRRIAAEAPAWLAPGGSLLTEVNEAQAPAAAAAFEAAGLLVRTLASEEYEVTVVAGLRAPATSS